MMKKNLKKLNKFLKTKAGLAVMFLVVLPVLTLSAVAGVGYYRGQIQPRNDAIKNTSPVLKGSNTQITTKATEGEQTPKDTTQKSSVTNKSSSSSTQSTATSTTGGYTSVPYKPPTCDEAKKAQIEQQRSIDVNIEQNRHIAALAAIDLAYINEKGSAGYNMAIASEANYSNTQFYNIETQYRYDMNKIFCTAYQ